MSVPGRKTVVSLLTLILLTALALVWDWNWFRDPLVRHLQERTGRHIELGELDVSWHHGQPMVHLHRLRVSNADWAEGTRGKPLVQAGELSASFKPTSLLRLHPEISLLVLRDAEVALERRADGQSNWRLLTPEDRNPIDWRIQRIEPQRSRVQLVDAQSELTLQAQAEGLSTPQTLPSGASLPTELKAQGRWRGQAFSAQAAVPRELPLRDTREIIELRAKLSAQGSELRFEGRVVDLLQQQLVSGDLQLAGPSLADWSPLWPTAWPRTPAYRVRATVHQENGLWQVPDLQLKLGKSDLHGDLRLSLHADPPLFEASLTSERWLWPDTVGTPAVTEGPRSGPSAAALRQFDARVSLRFKQVLLPQWPTLHQLRMNLKLDDGLLDLTPIHFDVASGQVQGLFSFDTRESPALLRAEFNGRNLRLEHLLQPLPDGQEATGAVSADLKLNSRGDSPHSWAEQAAGHFSLQLRGGRLSAPMDAQLARLISTRTASVAPQALDVPIHCGRLEAKITGGVADIDPLLFDTAKERIDGRGRFELATGQLSLALSPQAKDAQRGESGSVQLTGHWNEAMQRSTVADTLVAASLGCDPTSGAKR